MRLCLPFAFVVLVGSVVLPGQDPTPVDPLRDTVRGAIAWIGKQAVQVPGVDGAVLFPATRLASSCRRRTCMAAARGS